MENSIINKKYELKTNKKSLQKNSIPKIERQKYLGNTMGIIKKYPQFPIIYYFDSYHKTKFPTFEKIHYYTLFITNGVLYKKGIQALLQVDGPEYISHKTQNN